MNEEKEVLNIKLTDIIPNRFQPRLTFEQDGIKELCDSIKQHGLIQPLVLRRVGNKYEIIAGERRYKASTMAGLESVPGIIVDLDDGESAEVALIENIQRRELTSIEEARSYKNIIDLGGLKQDELAKRMGKTQSTVSNKLRLLNLCQEVQDALLKAEISERHARALLVLKNPNKEKIMLARIINERLNVKRTDEEVAKLKMEADEEIEDIIEEIEEVIVSSVVDSNSTEPIANSISTFAPMNNVNVNSEVKPVEEKEEHTPFKNPFFNFGHKEEVNSTNLGVVDNNGAVAVETEAPVVNTPNPFAGFANTFANNEQVENSTNEETEEAQAVSSNKYFNFFQEEESKEESKEEVSMPFASVPNMMASDNSSVELNNLQANTTPVVKPNIYEMDDATFAQFNPVNMMQSNETIQEEKVSNTSNYNMGQSVISDIAPTNIVQAPISNELVVEKSEEELNLVKEQENHVANLISQFPVYENVGDDLKNTAEFAPAIEQTFEPVVKSKIDPEKFITIIKAVRDLVSEIEDFDYYVEGEESDFEDYYQFVIKIDKERL